MSTIKYNRYMPKLLLHSWYNYFISINKVTLYMRRSHNVTFIVRNLCYVLKTTSALKNAH